MLSEYKVQNNKQDKDEFVSTIVINKQGDAFKFIRKSNLRLDPGKTDLISGHIQANGELPIQAMYREVKEETGIQPEEILKFFNLGTINLPHKLLKDKICHIYCIIIDFTLEELNNSVQNRALEQEVERVEKLDSIDKLLEDIKDEKSNWRVYCSKELEEKIEMAKKIIQQGKERVFDVQK